jgi:5'(3')-deoxyribonucleotidase
MKQQHLEDENKKLQSFLRLKKLNILLDMDGVLCDFLSGAIEVLNRDYNKDYDINQYASEFGMWATYDYYGISEKEFWNSINETPDFWYNLKPLPWAGQLYSMLQEIGEVTIITSPSLDPSCAMQKLRWLKRHLDINSNQVFIGSRKYLMAGNGLLIDDFQSNVEKFKIAGGEAILIPSNWNTTGLTWEKVKNTILNYNK